jgi:hypothetical protein
LGLGVLFGKPPHIDVDEVEHATFTQLGEKSVNLAYCSQILQNMDAKDSDNESARSEKEEARDEILDCLGDDVCNKLSGIKWTLLPFLDKAFDGVKGNLDKNIVMKKKNKWGPMIATRRSSRNHGNVNVLEKAKEYKKKNLEIPQYFNASFECLH